MIINLTPHDVVVILDKTVAVPASGQIARCSMTRRQVGSVSVDGMIVPVNKVVYGDVDLPDPQAGVFYIVSAMVAQAAPDRPDLLIVDDTVRNDAGQVIGCKAFAHV